MKKIHTIGLLFFAIIILACGMGTPVTAPETTAVSPALQSSTAISSPVEISSQTPAPPPTLEPSLSTSNIEAIPTFTAAPVLSSGHTCIAPQQPQTGIVVDVVDGDTIKVRMMDRTIRSAILGSTHLKAP